MNRKYLWIEFAILFFMLPLFYSIYFVQGTLLPVIWIFALVCVTLLMCDKKFDRKRFWNFGEGKKQLKNLMVRFLFFGLIILFLYYLFERESLFFLPKTNPFLWLVMIIAYPLLSVYAQEIIYRVFFFNRYHALFHKPSFMIFASAFSFGWAHMLFGNPVAVALSFLGGILFAFTYYKSKSAFLTSVEHSIYGGLVFSLGIGKYFIEVFRVF